MAEFLIGFIVVAVITFFVALVGHGIWLIAAAFLRFAFHIGEDADSRPRHCTSCGHPTGIKAGVCMYCGFRTPAALRRELTMAINQLNRLRREKKIPESEHKTVLQALIAETRQLAQQPGLDSGLLHELVTPQPGPQASPFRDDRAETPSTAPVPSAGPPEIEFAEPAASSDEPLAAEIVEPSESSLDAAVPDAVTTASSTPSFAEDPPASAARFSARRTLADMLQSFMEEKNIRWGELASGMLIVGSAIGLIISLRKTLAEISQTFHYFPALLFMLGTVAIHAAGLYTLRRWKLRSTSRGVLIIATLLVPLSFAAGIVLSGSAAEQIPVTSPIYIMAVLAGILGYGAVSTLSARALFVEGWWRLVVAVIGTCAGQLVIYRFNQLDTSSLLVATLLFLIPMASYLVATLAQLDRVARKPRLTPSRAAQSFTLLGIAAFSLAVPLALFDWTSGTIRATMTALSPSLGVAAAVVLGVGIAVHRRCDAKVMAETRTTGTALAIFGGLLMLGTVLLAWPAPDVLIAIGAVTAIALLVLAIIGRLPILHVGAVAAAAFAYLIVFLRVNGQLPARAAATPRDLLNALLMGRSGLALLVPAAVAGCVGAGLLWRQRLRAAVAYIGSAAGIACISLAIGLYAGFWSKVDADWTTLLFAIYAVATLIASVRLRRSPVTWAGSVLVLVTLVHGYGWNHSVAGQFEAWHRVPANPVLLAVVVHGLFVGLFAVLVTAWRYWPGGSESTPTAHRLGKELVEPLALSGAVSAALTVPYILFIPAGGFGIHAAYALGVALTWAIAGGLCRETRLVTAAHAAMTVAIGFAVAGIAVHGRGWSLEDLRHWQLQLTVLGIWCAISAGMRLAVRPWNLVHRLLKPTWPSTDQILLGLLVCGIVVIGVIGCRPGILVELGMASPGNVSAADSWHVHAYQWGSWLAMACIATALAAALYERISVAGLLGLVVVSAALPLLIAGGFEPTQSVASALRWAFAIYALVWSAIAAARDQISGFVRRVIPSAASPSESFASITRDSAMLLGLLPVVLLTTRTVIQVASGNALGGPADESFFGNMAPGILYAVPLAILVVTSLACAVRDGRASFAFLGSLLLVYVVVLAVLLPALRAGSVASAAVAASLAQWTAGALASYALAWLSLSKWIDRNESPGGGQLLHLQVALAGSATVILASWAFGTIFLAPENVTEAVNYLGRWPSYLAAILAAVAIAWSGRDRRHDLPVLAVGICCIIATLLAATINALDTTQSWLAYHTLTVGWLAVGMVAAGVACWRAAAGDWQGRISKLSGAAIGIACVVMVLLVRACVDDPAAALWTSITGGGLFVLLAALAMRGRSQWVAYASMGVVTFATTVVWCHTFTTPRSTFLTGLFYANVIAASLAGLVWLLVEIWFQSERNASFDDRFRLPPVHASVTGGATVLMLLLGVGGTAIATLARHGGGSIGDTISNPWAVGAIVGLAFMVVALQWDRRALLGPLAAYGWGIIAMALGLNYAERLNALQPHTAVVVACLMGAGYVALTGHLWKWGVNLAQLATRLRIPRAVAKLERTARWLPALNVIATILICALGFVTIFTAQATEERPLRMAVAFAPLVLAYGLSCLAQQRRKFAMQCFTLLVTSLAAVFIGWADVTAVSHGAGPLAYCARLLIVLAGTTLLYALVVARWIGEKSDWYDAVRRTSVIVAGGTIATLVVVLTLEVSLFEPRIGAPIATPEVIAISVMLFGFLVALLSMALLPGRDPLGLSQRGRTGYVYAAQGMAALLFAHIYLAEPRLFQLGLMEYWPYIVMILAFASVAFGEFCLRKGWSVIAEPMQRTGGFLPLLPALVAWGFSDARFSYPLVLFFAGLIYVFLSITRRSLPAGIAAAVMGNGALWALFTEQGFALHEQPQFWLIPPALSVLIAAHINRNRLSENALTAVRYICVMIIYLSSAGETFMRLMVPEGSEDWLRPVILASLSIAGIFAGIVLRVRAFLYLGASFLLLSIVAMVWNAGRLLDHTWPWWAFGITSGLVILIVFGVFEKHRSELQNLVTRLRQWEP